MYSFEEVLRLDPQKFPDAFSKIIANIQAEIEEAQKAGLDDADIDELVKENCDDIVEKYPKLIIQKKTPTPATKKSVKQKASPSSVPCEDVNEELAKAMAEIKELKKVTTPAQEKVAEKAAEKAVRTADSVRAKRKKIANYSKKYVTGERKDISGDDYTPKSSSKTTTGKATKSTKTTSSKAGKAPKAKTPPKKIVVDGKEVPAFSTGYLICRRAVGMDNKTLNRDTVKQFWKEIQDDINAERVVRADGVEKEIMVIQNVLGLALKNSENKERVKVQFSDGEIAQLRAIKERLMRTVVFMKQYDSVFTKKKRLASWLKRVKKAEKTKEISYTNPQGRKLEKIVDSLGRGEVASVTSRAFLSGLGSLASIYSAK